MKLIECHIENYGNISNADFKFSDGVTEFCEENGYGKTTLASFIKAMFYGLPSYRANANNFPDRKHYYPFGGGKFGGSLVFEKDGTEYRIERFFGKKSETDDSLVVYCKNKKYTGFGDDIGKAVFGLDKDSFERTTFINSDDIDICATGGISAKLNNFVSDLDDGESLDAVISAIEKPKKELKADRGDNGLIKTTRQEITDITNSIKNIEKIEQSLEQSYIEAGKLKQAILRQEAEIEEIKNRNSLIERWQHYEALLARKDGYVASQKELREQYPNGIPSQSEIAEMKNYNRQILALSGKQTAAVFDEAKQSRLDELTAVFADGVPSEQFLQGIKSDVEDIRNAEARLSALSGQGRSERFGELDQKFGKGTPSADELHKIEMQLERYRDLDNRQKAKTAVTVDNNIPAANKSRKFVLLAVLAVVLAVCGVAVLFISGMIGGIMLGIAGVGLLVVGFLYLKNLSTNRQTVVIDESAVQLQTEMRQIENAVREYLVRYGYYSQNGLIFDFEMLKSDLKYYLQNLDEATDKDNSLREQREIINKKSERIKAVFARYGVDCDDLQNAYIALQNKVSVINALLMDSEQMCKNRDDLAAEIDECIAAVKAILAKYKIALSEDISGQLDRLSAALGDSARLETDIASVQDEINKYKAKYKLTEKPTEGAVDISDITERLSRSRRELAVLESNISSAECDVENLEDKRRQLENAEEKLQAYQNKYNVLSATIKFLKAAEQNLKDRYIAPVRDKFLYYANMIEATLGEKISIDQDFNIMFERGGENRSDRHLSAGQRSVCALCFRLALVNNMYDGEKPFIIMDDPFVHLDQKHMERTRKTVRSLSKDNQIIYFCCHDSRRITV